MVALMDKPVGAAVHKILLSIASDYPQVGRGGGWVWGGVWVRRKMTCYKLLSVVKAVLSPLQALTYPFKISSSDFKFGSSQGDRVNQDAVEQLSSILQSGRKVLLGVDVII